MRRFPSGRVGANLSRAGGFYFMSGKRMIHEALFSNIDLNELCVEARYLYIATIIHADDWGRMKADPRHLKLKAFPFDSHSVDNVRTWRDQLATKAKMIQVYEVGGKDYLVHPGWDKWQTLRKDRMKPTDCPEPVNRPSTKRQPNDNQARTNDGLTEPKLTEVNRTEGKGSEPNGRESKGKPKTTKVAVDTPAPPSLALLKPKVKTKKNGHQKKCTCEICWKEMYG